MNNTLMHDPDIIKIFVDEFFALAELEEKHPTVPALALSIGFYATADILHTLQSWQNGASDYPDDSINILRSALTRIEDHFLSKGLDSIIPAPLVKFCLGAYHNVKEPEKQNQTSQTTALQIVFEAPNPDHKLKAITQANQSSVANLIEHQDHFQIEMAV